MPRTFTLSHKQYDLGGGMRVEGVEHKKVCFDFHYNLCLKISHCKKNSARCFQKCSYVRLHVQRHVILVRFK
jgi:hypothetical protein